MIGENCRPPKITIVESAASNDAKCARCGFSAHGIAVYFERRAAAAEIGAVAEELLTAERKPDTHRVLKRPGEATGVMLTVTVCPHGRIEHGGERLTVTELKRDACRCPKAIRRHRAIARQIIAAAPQEQMHGRWRHVVCITHLPHRNATVDAIDQRHRLTPRYRCGRLSIEVASNPARARECECPAADRRFVSSEVYPLPGARYWERWRKTARSAQYRSRD
jgi:hypothetical protein